MMTTILLCVLLGSDLHRFRPALALGLRFNL